MTDVMDNDVVVVGGGTAGLAAALVLARARRRITVIDAGEPRNAPASHMHGFLTRDGASPGEFLAKGRDEVTGFGGTIVQDVVRGIERAAGNGFVVERADGSRTSTRAVLVATGLRDELPDVPGLVERWGHDVLHCPYCHGYELRDAPIGVLGGDARPFTMHQASLVRQWSGDVTFFPNRIVLTDEERERFTARGIRVVDGEVARVVARGDHDLRVELMDGSGVDRAAVFVGPRFLPLDELLVGLGCEVDDNGWVAADPRGGTSLPGVWAAGNVVSEGAQLANAAAAGSAAAIAINHYLMAQDVEEAVTAHRVEGTPAPA
jgi:thioredoxin reductase